MSGKPYFLYVLWSDSGRRFYIGISEDADVRLKQHNEGAARSWTSRYRPWELVLAEPYPDYTSARRRELEPKAQRGGHGFFAKTGFDPDRFRVGS